MPNNLFEFKSPQTKPITLIYYLGYIARFFYYIKHTYVHYSQTPEPPAAEITDTFPAGAITEKEVELCKDIFEKVEARGDRLEEKANYLLAVIAFLMPVALSLAIYSITKVDNKLYKYTILFCDVVVLFLLFTAFIAASKIIIVQGRQNLHFFSVIKDNGSEIRPYNPEFYSRGLLWCASYNTAINDHIADYLRGCHLFTIISVFLLVFSAMPALYYAATNKDVQDIKGTVSVTSTSSDLKAFRNLSSIKSDIKIMRSDIEQIKGLQKNSLNVSDRRVPTRPVDRSR
jgi:hypothetical protein